MLHDLLADARAQAERSEPQVRGAALLRIARVETVTSPGAARDTFDRGLDAIRALDGTNRAFLLEQAALLAAAVVPDYLHGNSELRPHPLWEHMVLELMLDHGHLNHAVFRLMHLDPDPHFPFTAISVVMSRLNDESAKIALFRRGVEVWRDMPQSIQDRSPDHEFFRFFREQWKTPPEAEALMIAREIVRKSEEQPDKSISAGYQGDVEITSWRAYACFEILHILRHLDSGLAETLISKHEQLARAARRFPKGHESMAEEAERQRRERAPSCGGGWLWGDPDDFPYLRSLQQASLNSDYAPALELVIEKHRKDSNPEDPNAAPRECWPSTVAYRDIFYSAAKQLGDGAAAYLPRVPNEDLRLFAQIELAAALAGLPKMREAWREYRPRQRGALL